MTFVLMVPQENSHSYWNDNISISFQTVAGVKTFGYKQKKSLDDTTKMIVKQKQVTEDNFKTVWKSGKETPTPSTYRNPVA